MEPSGVMNRAMDNVSLSDHFHFINSDGLQDGGEMKEDVSAPRAIESQVPVPEIVPTVYPSSLLESGMDDNDITPATSDVPAPPPPSSDTPVHEHPGTAVSNEQATSSVAPPNTPRNPPHAQHHPSGSSTSDASRTTNDILRDMMRMQHFYFSRILESLQRLEEMSGQKDWGDDL